VVKTRFQNWRIKARTRTTDKLALKPSQHFSMPVRKVRGMFLAHTTVLPKYWEEVTAKRARTPHQPLEDRILDIFDKI